jgi:hypothetical protein
VVVGAAVAVPRPGLALERPVKVVGASAQCAAEIQGLAEVGAEQALEVGGMRRKRLFGESRRRVSRG